MGNYSIFEIHLKALSHISITEKVYGILYKTYRFIPAWTMWNSFVKLYAVNNWDESKNEENYTGVQEKFRNIRLTNFYPIVDGKLYSPFLENNEENIVNQIDERNLISSDLKVSIDPLTNTSEFGQLYEREYLTAKKFIGWVKVKNEIDWNNFWDNLKNKILFIGADKNTGFGRVVVEKVKENESDFREVYIMEKLESSNFADNRKKTFLFPPEVEIEKLFPLVLRSWDNERGDGLSIKLIYH